MVHLNTTPSDRVPHLTLKRNVELADRQPPTEFRLFGKGANETTKGVFLFDGEAAAMVMAAAADWGNDFPIDYDHAMLDPIALDPAASKRAAGWFQPAVRNGELWAVNVRWTPPAAEAIRNAEWRYVSPAFNTDPDGRISELTNCALTNLPATKRMAPLVAANGVATREGVIQRAQQERPTMTEEERKAARKRATDEFRKRMGGMYTKAMGEAFAKSLDDVEDSELKKMVPSGPESEPPAARKSSDDEAGKKSSDGDADEASRKAGKAPEECDDDGADEAAAKRAKAASRGAGARLLSKIREVTGTDDIDTAIGALEAMRVGSTELTTLAREVAELRKARENDERGALVTEGLRAGKITPAEAADAKGFIATLSTAQLRGFLTFAPQRVRPSREGGTPPNRDEAAPVTLTALEREIATNMGVKFEAVAERKRVHQLRRAELNALNDEQ